MLAWSPHPDHRRCYTACYRPCQLEYTHLLRYERLAEDWSLFLEDAGLQGAGLGLGWHNRGLGAASASGYWDQVSIVTRDPANCGCCMQVTREQKLQLEEIFREDLDMFGYKDGF